MPRPSYYDEDEPDDQQDAVKGNDKASSTALLPKSILMGKDFKVGEEVVLKITAIRGDSVQVEYATGGGEDEGPAKEPPPGEADESAAKPGGEPGEPVPAGEPEGGGMFD